MTTDASPTPIRGTECEDCDEPFLFRRESIPNKCPECRRADGRQVGLGGWSDE